MKNESRGFTLIELLIVVAIILIIAAIAIPNLLRSRIAANQASAVGSLRTINTGEVTYSSTFNSGFSATLGYLGPPTTGSQPTATAAGVLDNVLSGSAQFGPSTLTTSKSGYNFTYTPTNQDVTSRYNGYTVTASPVAVDATGTNFYFTDESQVIRLDSSGTATASSTPLGG